MTKTLKFSIAVLLLFFVYSTSAEIFIRYNQAGYSPLRSKPIIVLSDDAIKGVSWKLTNEDGSAVLSGILTSSLVGQTDHTAKPFNYLIDLSDATKVGKYKLTVGANKNVELLIEEQPYQFLIQPMLRFLRVARSGTEDTLITPASHMGDQSAMIYRPFGDPSLGQWKIDGQAKTVDMLGGWYDAADYIKFTLTTAYTSYYLLRSYQEYPQLFEKKLSSSELVDILDEAKIGLDYLIKTHPSDDEFIIQLSSGDDHNQGYRLPQNDSRDGEREAFSAISPAHMGFASAALAIGSQVFNQQQYKEMADKYRAAAIKIYQRARADDALDIPAFERNNTNDFYRDDSANDNMGLAAIELYKLTNDLQYLEQAEQYSLDSNGATWTAWCCVTSSLNYRLSEYSSQAKDYLIQELEQYRSYDKNSGNIWGIPMKPGWAPLLGSAVVASYSGLNFLTQQDQNIDLLWNNLDYFLGKNNWGVSFVAEPSLLRPAENVYSQVYSLTKEYPLGAVSEGPGSRSGYQQLKSYFITSEKDAYFEPFNTPTQVFYDNSSNFQTMESTIAGQATAIYLLTIASKAAQVDSRLASTLPTTISKEPDVPQINPAKKASSGGTFYWLCLITIFIFFKRNNIRIKIGVH